MFCARGAVVFTGADHSSMNRTQSTRRSNRLFVSWAEFQKGQPVSKQHRAYWVVEAIDLSHQCVCMCTLPMGWLCPGLFLGTCLCGPSVQQRKSLPLTFVRFNKFDLGVLPTGRYLFEKLSGNMGGTIFHNATPNEYYEEGHMVIEHNFKISELSRQMTFMLGSEKRFAY